MTNLTNGADVYYGDDTSETVYGLGGADILKGKGGNDYLDGGGEDDWINGGAGNDYMVGGTGNDTFEVGGIYSGMIGGLNSGWDTYIGGEGSDRILISSTYGYVWTAIMIDHIEGVETIVNGSNGPGYIYVLGNVDFTDVTQWINMDAIIGSSWADTIRGSEFVAETIESGNGNDFIDGRGGANILTGGAGSDIFNVSSTSDTSTITDFAIGSDHVQFASAIANGFSDLTISDASGDALVTVGSVAITLTGVNYTSLSSSDFLFA